MEKHTLHQLLDLPLDERIRLVEALWDSIAVHPDALPVSDEQRAELDQRLRAYQANPEAGSSWKDVKARLLRDSVIELNAPFAPVGEEDWEALR